MSDTYTFKGGVTQYGSAIITEQLEGNLYAWLQWSLLGIGAFENIVRGQVDSRNTDRSRLQRSTDPRYTAGTVWQGHRGDWCWESGINYSTQPIQVTGVWVNSVFTPIASGGPRVNYPLGQVVFPTPLPATAVVQVAYSPRFVQVRRADEPWVKQVLFDTFRADRFLSPSASGGAGWDLLAESRVQLPAIVIEPVLNGSSFPSEIGNSAQVYREDFLLHVLAETPWDRKRLRDILRVQVDKRVPTFNRNEVTYPLDGYGRIVTGAMTYPDMCQAHPWTQARIVKATPTDQETIGNHLWWSTVRYSIEVDAR